MSRGATAFRSERIADREAAARARLRPFAAEYPFRPRFFEHPPNTPAAGALPNFRRRDIHSPSVQHDRGWKIVARHSTDGTSHSCLFDSPPVHCPMKNRHAS